MNTYNFRLMNERGEQIGWTSLRGDELPTHLTICMAALCRNNMTATYRMVCDGRDLDSCPVNPERYLSHEFRKILNKCNNAWFGSIIELETGERVKLVGFGYDISNKDYHFSAWHDSGYRLLNNRDLVNARVIEQGYNNEF